jgi:hypothetical protein
VKFLVATPPASVVPNWPSAAEAAIAALYALSPQPQELMAAVLDEMFKRCVPGGFGNHASLIQFEGLKVAHKASANSDKVALF